MQARSFSDALDPSSAHPTPLHATVLALVLQGNWNLLFKESTRLKSFKVRVLEKVLISEALFACCAHSLVCLRVCVCVEGGQASQAPVNLGTRLAGLDLLLSWRTWD